jgi:histone H3
MRYFICQVPRHVFFHSSPYLESFTSDSACQVEILGHNCDTLGVDCAQVGIFEETDEVGLSGFLESLDCRALESEFRTVFVCDLTNKSLEW